MIYEDSEMNCPFTQTFTDTLAQELGWEPVKPARDFKPTPPNIAKINRDLPPRLSSSCWQDGDEITIRAILRDVNTGEFLASAVVRFLKSEQREPLIYEPRGYTAVQIEKKAFPPGYFRTQRSQTDTGTATPEVLIEYPFSPIGGLEIDIWTGEGRGAPILYSGRYGENLRARESTGVSPTALHARGPKTHASR